MKRRIVIIFIIVFNLLLLPSISSAAPVEAHAVYVEGVVNFVSIEDAGLYPVEVDTPFHEGDRVMTGSSGKVEIEFDTGALLLLENDTDMTIKALSRDDKGSISAIFDLAVGLIKSSFSKLTKDDRVEYHTKTALAGIAGTPEHIIEADVTSQGVDRTNVYLLGEASDEGSLFVRGFDANETEVTLLAGQGTTILAGLAPVVPFLLGPEILQGIGNLIFHTGGGAASSAGGAAGAASTAGTTSATTTAATATTGATTAGAATAGTAAAAGGIGVGTVAAVGAGVAGVAVAAGGASSGGGSSGGDTTTGTGTSGGGDTTTGSGTSGADSDSSSIPDISGTWAGSWSESNSSECSDSGGSGAWSGSFTQNGGTASGSINCTTGCDEGGSVSWSATYNASSDTWAVSISGDGSGGGTISGNSFSGSFSESCIDESGNIVGTGTVSLTGSKQ